MRVHSRDLLKVALNFQKIIKFHKSKSMILQKEFKKLKAEEVMERKFKQLKTKINHFLMLITLLTLKL